MLTEETGPKGVEASRFYVKDSHLLRVQTSPRTARFSPLPHFAVVIKARTPAPFVPPVYQGHPLQPRPPKKKKTLMCACFISTGAHCKTGVHHWRVNHGPSRSFQLLLWFTGSVNQQSAISHVIYGLAGATVFASQGIIFIVKRY